jgi:hypothetical protein
VPPIKQIKIENYKSVESASFRARRINVFIGEPNSGKSNLLEALGWLCDGAPHDYRNLFRSPTAVDLFPDSDLSKTIKIGLDDWSVALGLTKDQKAIAAIYMLGEKLRGHLRLLSNGRVEGEPMKGDSPVRFYFYRPTWSSLTQTPEQYGFLRPPFGLNLADLLYSHAQLRSSVGELLRSKGFRLEIRPQKREMLFSKEVDGVIFSYPFEAMSETLRRIVFYKAVLETNRDSVLVLDEPEANTFPFYTKYLAERIALDETNQFFLTTHNPYVLMSIIEKTPKADLAVYVTRMKNYRTELRLLEETELSEALDLGMDLFLNLDRYFPE